MPATAIWRNCPTGHGARRTSTIGSRISSTPRKRSSKKGRGGAKGRPNLATIKPVLHNNTKKPGKAIGARVVKKEAVGALPLAPAAAGRLDMVSTRETGSAPGRYASAGGKV